LAKTIERRFEMKRTSIVLTVLVIVSLMVSPVFAGRSKGVSPEDAAALKSIGIDLSSSTPEQIEAKAEAIERLVTAIKSLSEARMLEAKARQEEAKAAKAELKLQQQAEKAELASQKAAQKAALAQAKMEEKKRKASLGGKVGTAVNNGAGKTTKSAINAFSSAISKEIKNIFK
jgi:hypothetical protein